MAQRVVIELSASRVVVATMRGSTVTGYRSSEAQTPDWIARWPVSLASIEGVVSGMIKELEATGAKATIIYAAPTTIASVYSCPVAAGRQAAERAALLALTEQSSTSTGLCPGATHVVGTDLAASIDKPAQIHTLAMIDREASAEAVAAWARQVGVKPELLLPADAPALLSVVSSLAARNDPKPTAMLWFGEHSSVLAAWASGSLRFVRVLRMGTETLVDVLARPIRKPGTTETVTLSRAEARKVLRQVGVPAPDQAIEGNSHLRGAMILPLLQPVLQRFGVETKQSLRFGLSDTERTEVVLSVQGDGGLIPRLGEVIAGQCGVQPEVRGGQTIGCMLGGPGDGLIAPWTMVDRLESSLLPKEMNRALVFSRIRKGAWAGMAAALALVGIHAATTHLAIAQAREDLKQVESVAGEEARKTELQTKALALQESRVALERRINSELGELPDWSGALELLAESAPSNVRLSSIDMVHAEAAPTVTLVGFVTTSDLATCATTLRDFAATLGNTPIVKDVKLGATQRVDHRGQQAQRFEMTVVLVPVPPAAIRPPIPAPSDQSPSEGAHS